MRAAGLRCQSITQFVWSGAAHKISLAGNPETINTVIPEEVVSIDTRSPAPSLPDPTGTSDAGKKYSDTAAHGCTQTHTSESLCVPTHKYYFKIKFFQEETGTNCSGPGNVCA